MIPAYLLKDNGGQEPHWYVVSDRSEPIVHFLTTFAAFNMQVDKVDGCVYIQCMICFAI